MPYRMKIYNGKLSDLAMVKFRKISIGQFWFLNFQLYTLSMRDLQKPGLYCCWSTGANTHLIWSGIKLSEFAISKMAKSKLWWKRSACRVYATVCARRGMFHFCSVLVHNTTTSSRLEEIIPYILILHFQVHCVLLPEMYPVIIQQKRGVHYDSYHPYSSVDIVPYSAYHSCVHQ